MDDIVFQTARAQRTAVVTKQISAVELLQEHLAQIAHTNPKINAIVTFDPEGALRIAGHIDALIAHAVDMGVLAGLPIVHKDLTEVAGMRFTRGSPIFKDTIGVTDSLIVARLKNAGAVTLGKSNTPEFGAGSQTFNPVFGATNNPHDVTKTAGGSSGGAAAALSCRMVPIADGSDMGGSLRNPAAFCGVVGFRPSPGIVPVNDSWSPLAVDGPMARTVGDVALMLAALAGVEPHATLTAPADLSALREFDPISLKDKRIAWAQNWGGLSIETDLATVIAAQRQRFVDLGAEVVDACPDFAGVDEAFQTLRALGFETSLGELLDTHPDQLKDTVQWNIRAGRALSGADIARAQRLQSALFVRMKQFMRDFDMVVGPVTQVLPFDVTQPYITHINGVEQKTYVDWMRSCYYITMTLHPALSLPCGFATNGLPVGLQLVGRYRDDVQLLRMAAAIESTIDMNQFIPAIARR